MAQAALKEYYESGTQTAQRPRFMPPDFATRQEFDAWLLGELESAEKQIQDGNYCTAEEVSAWLKERRSHR